MIHRMTGDGVTVVMCTHLLLEAEGLAEQIVVLESGTALVAGRPDELVRDFWPTRVVRMDAAPLEPLLAMPGRFGIRTEDVVAVREHSAENLTPLSADLVVL